MNSVVQRWSLLAPRERWLVVAALILALVVGAVSALGPLLAERAAARERLDRALEDSAWLRAQAAAGRLVVSACGAGDVQPADLAARRGVTLEAEAQGPDGELRLTLAARDGNAVLALVSDLDCRGFELIDLILERDGGGAVRGEARFHPPVTKPS